MISKQNIFKHPVTGEEYIRGGQKIIFESGILCSLDEFEETLKMKKPEIEALMQEWSEDHLRYKYDYSYALTTGILRHYQQKKPAVEAKPANIKPEIAENLQKQAEKQLKKLVLTPALIILLVMCLVGTMSAGMSAYHTTVANKIFGRPVAVGLITGTVMVLFSATAFTAARWFWTEKGFARFFAVLFASLGIVVIAYSMMSTLIVNYTAWSSTDVEEKAESAEHSEELSSYNEQIKLKREELSNLQATEAELNTQAEYWKDKSWKRYDALQEQLVQARADVSRARSELTSLISERPQIASKAGEEREDAFGFLSFFIKVDARTLRFFMQAVPAMFFDIIAPFALSCAIYLAEKRKEEASNE